MTNLDCRKLFLRGSYACIIFAQFIIFRGANSNCPKISNLDDHVKFQSALDAASNECDDGWCPYGDFCLNLVLDKKVNWQTANHNCRNNYFAELMSIHSEAENNFTLKLVNLAGEVAVMTWIGLNKLKNRKRTFEWSDGSSSNDWTFPWGPGQPDHGNIYSEESCVEFLNDQVDKKYATIMNSSFIGKWNDQRCDSHRTYICKKLKKGLSTPKPPGSTTKFVGRCEPGWKKFGEKCYRLSEEEAKFTVANKKCQTSGDHIRSDLVSIHSLDEQKFVQGLLSAENISVWIGGQSKNDWISGAWSWTDESEFDYNGSWENGEVPHHLPQKTDTESIKIKCIAMNGNQKTAVWFAAPNCSNEHKYICAQLNEASTHRSKLTVAVMSGIVVASVVCVALIVAVAVLLVKKLGLRSPGGFRKLSESVADLIDNSAVH